MGSAKQAFEAIVTYGGEPRPRTGQITRHLQDDTMLPKSAGRKVEHINATNLATLLLAVAATPMPAESTRTALTWGRMTPDGKALDGRDWDDPGRQRFMLIEVLTDCIAMVWKEAGRGPLTETVVQSFFDITIGRPHAIVTLDGRRTEYLPIGAEAELVEFPGFHRVCRIPGAVIRSVAMAIHEGPHHGAILALQTSLGRDPYREPAALLAH
jgi:hypothetical protein